MLICKAIFVIKLYIHKDLVYGELDPMSEYRAQFAFKGKREHIAKVKIKNLTYPN